MWQKLKEKLKQFLKKPPDNDFIPSPPDTDADTLRECQQDQPAEKKTWWLKWIFRF